MLQTAFKENKIEDLVCAKMDRDAGSDGEIERVSDMEIEVVTDEGSGAEDMPEQGEIEESPERIDMKSRAIAVEIERRSMASRKSADGKSVWSATGSRTARSSACRYRLAQNKVANEIFLAKSETRSKLAQDEVK